MNTYCIMSIVCSHMAQLESHGSIHMLACIVMCVNMCSVHVQSFVCMFVYRLYVCRGK